MAAIVNTSRLPKKKWIGKPSVWVALELQTPIKNQRESMKILNDGVTCLNVGLLLCPTNSKQI
jgi:hypothetical protein